jgi:putative flippase GtrA
MTHPERVDVTGVAAVPGGAVRVPEGPGGRQRVVAFFDHQVTRFALIGVVNTAFSFAMFAGLQLTIGAHVHYLVILLLAHVTGVLEAYVLQRWLVFRVSGRWWRDLARFWSVYLAALGVNAVALPLLVEIVHLAVLPAQALVMGVTALGTFVAHRNFSFRRTHAPAEASSTTTATGAPRTS